MGYAILGTFTTKQKAKDYIEEVIEKEGCARDKLHIFHEPKDYPYKPWTVNLE